MLSHIGFYAGIGDHCEGYLYRAMLDEEGIAGNNASTKRAEPDEEGRCFLQSPTRSDNCPT